MFIRFFFSSAPLNSSLLQVSSDIARVASDEFSICLRTIWHLAKVFMFKAIGAVMENNSVR